MKREEIAHIRRKRKTSRSTEAFHGRLPDGVTTTNSKVYINAWRKASLRVGKLIGGRLYAFDPGFTYIIPHKDQRPQIEEFSSYAVNKINAGLEAYIAACALRLSEKSWPAKKKYIYDPRAGYMRTPKEMARATKVEEAARGRERRR